MQILHRVFVVCLVLAAAAVLRVAWAMAFDPAYLVHTRNALFFHATREAALFDLPPDALVDRGFLSDDEEARQAWRARIDAEVPYMADLTEADLDALQWVRTLVPRFSKNGGTRCGRARDLMDQLKRLPRGSGEGCCSDHAQALIALLSSRGVIARQVHHASHTFNEFWYPEHGQWVFVDPHYAVLARDPARPGHYLSLMGLRRAYLAGSPVVYEFIGSDAHRLHDGHPLEISHYDDGVEFRDPRITWGNNVFAEDALEARLGWLPKAVRQGLGLASGRLPAMVTLQDAFSTDTFDRYRRQRGRMLALVALLAMGLVAYPVARWLPLREAGAREGSAEGPSQP